MYNEELITLCNEVESKVDYLKDVINGGYASRMDMMEVLTCMKRSLKFLNQLQHIAEAEPVGYSGVLDVMDLRIEDIAKIEIPGGLRMGKSYRYSDNLINYGKSNEACTYLDELTRYRSNRIRDCLGPITQKFRPNCAKKIKEGNVAITEIHVKNLMYTPYDYFSEYIDKFNQYSFDTIVLNALAKRSVRVSGDCLGDYLPSIQELLNEVENLGMMEFIHLSGAFEDHPVTYRDYIRQLMTLVIIFRGPKRMDGPFMQFVDDLNELSRNYPSPCKTVLGKCIQRLYDATGAKTIANSIYNELLNTVEGINRAANEMYKAIVCGRTSTFVVALHPASTREYDMYIGYVNNVYKLSSLPVGMPFIIYGGNYEIDDHTSPAFINPEHIYMRTKIDTITGYFKRDRLEVALKDDFSSQAFKENIEIENPDPNFLIDRVHSKYKDSAKLRAKKKLWDSLNVVPLFDIGSFQIKLQRG